MKTQSISKHKYHVDDVCLLMQGKHGTIVVVKLGYTLIKHESRILLYSVQDGAEDAKMIIKRKLNIREHQLFKLGEL